MKLEETKILFLGLTNKCNGRCIMCWHSNENPYPCQEIDKAQLANIRDDLFDKIDYLHLVGGGEQMLYSDMDNLLASMRHYNFKLIITTNGSVISEKQRQLLLPLDVNIIISLDGSTKEIQETIRPNCDYDAVVENIKYFTSNGKTVILRVTLSNHNYQDMDNIITLAENLGVAKVKFQCVEFLSNLDEPYKFSKPPEIGYDYVDEILAKHKGISVSVSLANYRSDNKDFEEYYDIVPSVQQKDYCGNTRHTIYIQEDGRVLSCCLPNSKVMGDLNINTLEEILDSFEYDDNRLYCSCAIMRRSSRRDSKFKDVVWV